MQSTRGRAMRAQSGADAPVSGGKVATRVMDLLAPLADILRSHAAWAGPMTALAGFLIALVGVGLLMPAAAIMLLVGGLVGAGTIDGAQAFLGTLLGTVTGTSLGYHIGLRAGPRVLSRRPLKRHRRQVARARLLFRRQGTLALALSRFLGPLRSIAPFVAGTMRMPRRRFEAANVLSAALWVAVMLAPGWLALRGWTSPPPPAAEAAVASGPAAARGAER